MYSHDLRQRAESGDTEAMRELAMAYASGNGIAADLDEALSWIERAAYAGNAEAQSEMADICRGENDFTASFEWEQKAATQGLPQAQYNLAIHYRDGMGTAENPDQQFYWFQKAAQKGHLEAKNSLAVCYLNGWGTLQDFAQAIRWLEQASDEGHAPAKTRLGAAYIEGIGVSADKVKGLSLLQEAAALGDEKAKGLLRTKEVTAISGSSSKGKCYVATCVYGSYDCPEVWTLRRFRDETLSHSWGGRLFIRTYYAISPQVVRAFSKRKWFNKMWKPAIDGLVNKLQHHGVDNSPYYDR
jgi:hypothetical protein